MRRLGPLLAMVLVAVVNLAVLAGVAWNRHGAPEALLTLTEREAPLAPIWKENSGMWLRLEWTGGGNPWGDVPRELPGRRDWSTAKRMQELGFDPKVAADDPFAATFYAKARPLERYAVLAYEGAPWKEWLAGEERAIEDLARQVERREATAEQLEDARRRLANERASRSRLALVDLGRDRAELRSRYPDRTRFIVTLCVARIILRRDWDPGTRKPRAPYLDLVVDLLLPYEVHVPRPERPLLEALRQRDQANAASSGGWVPFRRDEPPRYAITLAYGRRLEPWIADIRPIEGDAAPGR